MTLTTYTIDFTTNAMVTVLGTMAALCFLAVLSLRIARSKERSQ